MRDAPVDRALNDRFHSRLILARRLYRSGAEQDSQKRARFDELITPNSLAQEALVLWPEHPLDAFG